MLSIRSLCHFMPGAALAAVAACSSPADPAEPDAGGVDAQALDARALDAPAPSTWARSIGGADLALGSDEGVVIAGSFEGTLTLGDHVLVSGGTKDAFIAKLDAGGNPRWTLSFGGKSNDAAVAVALDGNDDVYVCGTFKNTVDVAGQVLTAGAREAEFLLKLDGATGARIWAVRAGGSLAQRQDLAVAPDGATIAVVGDFRETIDLAGTDVTSAGELDLAVAVYGATGQPRWARSFGGPQGDRAAAVTLVGGDVVVGGHYTGQVSLGGGPLSPHGANATFDAFLARYAGTDGAHVWSSGYGGPDIDEVLALDADADTLYVGGVFTATADFGGSALVSAGLADGFLATYDTATGAHQWSTRLGGTGADVVFDLAPAGEQLGFAGYFSANVMLGASTLTSAGGFDALYGTTVAATGDFLAADRAGGPGFDGANRIVLTAQDIWLSGAYTGDVTLFGVPLSTTGGGFLGRTAR